jgi:hypothetical protein
MTAHNLASEADVVVLEGHSVLLSETLVALVSRVPGEIRLMRYMLERPQLPGGWVEVDLDDACKALGYSRSNLKRVLLRLKRLGIAEQKRPRSPLWRISPAILRQVHGKEVDAAD